MEGDDAGGEQAVRIDGAALLGNEPTPSRRPSRWPWYLRGLVATAGSAWLATGTVLGRFRFPL